MIDKADIRPTLQSIPWLMDLSQDQLKKIRKDLGISLFRRRGNTF